MKIAIPNKGRLYDKTKQLLDKIGIKIPENGRGQWTFHGMLRAGQLILG